MATQKWETGLELREYYRMLCSMTETQRDEFFELTDATTVIEAHAFAGCTSLALTSLPQSLTTDWTIRVA